MFKCYRTVLTFSELMLKNWFISSNKRLLELLPTLKQCHEWPFYSLLHLHSQLLWGKAQKIRKGRNKGKAAEIFLSPIPNGQKSETGKTSKYAARKLIATATWEQAAGVCKSDRFYIIIIVTWDIQSPELAHFRWNMISSQILLQKYVEITTIIWYQTAVN